MARVRITQVGSQIDRPKTQKNTLKSIGLGRINKSIELEHTPSLAGTIQKIQHLIKVEEI